MSRPAHNFTASDIATLRQCVAGEITLTACAEKIGTSRDSCVYRMERDGLGLPPACRRAREARHEPKVDRPEKLRPSDGWVPIAHKSKREWIPYDGAPLTIGEAQMLREAGHAFCAQQRIDGGFDFLVRARK